MGDDQPLADLPDRALTAIRNYCAAGYEGRWDDMLSFTTGPRVERMAKHIAEGTIISGKGDPYPWGSDRVQVVSIETDGERIIVEVTIDPLSGDRPVVRRQWFLTETSDGLKVCD